MITGFNKPDGSALCDFVLSRWCKASTFCRQSFVPSINAVNRMRKGDPMQEASHTSGKSNTTLKVWTSYVVIKPSNWSFSDGIMFFFTLKKQQVRCSIRQTSFLGRFMSDFFWVNQPLAEIQNAEDDEKFYFMVALILQSCN